MAQYAVLIYADDSAHDPHASPEQSAQQTATADAHADQLASAGSMLLAYALTPREMATSLRAGSVSDGPFIEAKEVVAGFYILEAPDLDTALAIAGTNPVLSAGGGVEVRPVHSGGLVQP